MREKFLKISRLEGVILLLTGLFAAGTLVWFLAAPPPPPVAVQTLAPAAEALPVPDAPGLLAGEVLDLNRASAGDLTRLPGIGETKAQAIVTWREENGGFSQVEQLLEV